MVEAASSFTDLSEGMLGLVRLSSTRAKLYDHLLRFALFAINYCLISEAA